ncbi:MAG: hypothetical protein ACOX8K_13890 [Lachnospiraceae bacterium]
MIVAKFSGSCVTTVHGLTRWDYGQKLMVHTESAPIPNGTEVQFYQGTLSSVGYIKDTAVDIPDRMLQNPQEITAYVYVCQPDSGETILTMRLPIKNRERPENYVLPKTEECKRLLPEGGKLGQVLRKASDDDYKVEWAEAADGLQLIGNELQLLSGDIPIGQRVRLPASTGGGEIELRNNGTEIQWRYTNSNKWNTLVSLSELRGPAGETPEFEIREGHLFVKYKN